MERKTLFSLVLVGLLVTSLTVPAWAKSSKTKMITQKPVMKMTTPIPKNLTTPDKVKTSIGTLDFFDGVPIGNT